MMNDSDSQSDHEDLTNQLKDSFRFKLKKLSKRTEDDVKYQKQFNTLQRYVTELSEQNEILVQTIEELENDSNDRIITLENKLKNNELLLKEEANRGKHFELRVENYEAQNLEMQNHMQMLENEVTSIGEENLRYQAHINNLEYDLDQLVDLIKKARIDGEWELPKLNLKVVPVETLLHPETVVDPLPRKYTESVTENHVDELKLQLHARDRTISMLERELKLKMEEYHAVIDQVSHTGEMVDSVKNDVYQLEKLQNSKSSEKTYNHVLIQQLESRLQSVEAEAKEDGLLKELQNERNLVTKLQDENFMLQDTMELRLIDLKNKDQSIEILERQLNELKEKLLEESFEHNSNENENYKLQWEEADRKINDLHQYIDELNVVKDSEERNQNQQANYQNKMIEELQQDLKEAKDNISSQSVTINQLTEELNTEKRKVFNLGLNLGSKITETETNSKKDINRKDREMRMLQGQIQKLESQKNDYETKLTLREKAIERLQIQQKEYMNEVTRRDTALHKLELKLLQVEDDKRILNDELEHLHKTDANITKDLKLLKEQHNTLVTEKGKLEAQMKAYIISNDCENTVLNEEVTKREELIRQLQQENYLLSEENQSTKDTLDSNSQTLEEGEKEIKILKNQLRNKDMIVIDLQATVTELKTKEEIHKNKFEQYEDEAREIILKLNTAERALEQETHQVVLKEEQIQEMINEAGNLQNEIYSLKKAISSNSLTTEQLSNDVIYQKKLLQEKEKQTQDYLAKLKKSEQNNSNIANEFENLKREISDKMASKDHKIMMLKEELEISQQRYSDVNDELTSTELQLEARLNECKLLSHETNELRQDLQETREDLQEYEMNLAVTSEKHQTSVKENTVKDKTLLNLQSELDAVQQEFEHTVEELAQKTEEMENMKVNLEELEGKYSSLEADREETHQKIEENIDVINEVQMKNSQLNKDVTVLKEGNEKLKEEMLSCQEYYENLIRDLQCNIDAAKNNIVILEDDNKLLQFEFSVANEKNAELLNLKDKEADEKQDVLFKYEDLRETYEDHKNEKEKTISDLSEKVTTLEGRLHESTLTVSQLDGNLKLTQEKLKNVESQLSERERMVALSKLSNEGLQAKVNSQEDKISKTTYAAEELEKKSSEQFIKLQSQNENIIILQKELDSTKSLLDDSKLRNTRCEEIIREMRDKLSSKFHESDHQNELRKRLEVEHNTLQEIHERVQEELLSAEKMNSQLLQEISNLQSEANIKVTETDQLQADITELVTKLNNASEEKLNANERIAQLDGKFTILKTSLEKDNFALLEENCSLKETLSDKTNQISMMEQNIKGKEEENKVLEDRIMRISDLLSKKENELDVRNEEFYSCEQTVSELHHQLQQVLDEKKSLVFETSKQLENINQLRIELTDMRQQLKDTAQKLAHYEEKSSLTDRNLSTTQDQLSARIAEIVKLEKFSRKVQSDYKKSQETNKVKEIQIGELSQLLDQSKQDYLKSHQKCDGLLEENKAQKAALLSYEAQLDESHNQTERLSIRIENQQNLIRESEQALKDMQNNVNSSQLQVDHFSSECEEQRAKLNDYAERDDELSTKLRDCESSNLHLHTELENLLQKNKSCLEQISSKDAELRVLKAELHAYQKKLSHQEKQALRNNEQIERQMKEIKKLRDSFEKAQHSMTEHDYESEKLRSELLSVKSNLHESVEQLSLKSRELASVKTDLSRTQQTKMQAEQQFSVLDSKYKKLKTELKKSLERNKLSANELSVLTKNLNEIKIQLQQAYDQQRKCNEELTNRDEKIVVLKVDLASTEERLKVKDEEGDRLKNEVLKLNQQHHKVLEQLHETKRELDSVKTNGDRLTRESELVVENMSTWVKEQRQGNDKLATKLSSQSGRISQLENSNSKLKYENDRLKKEIEKSKVSIGDKRSEIERLKKQQSQSAQHSVTLHQMKSHIQELEQSVESEKVSKQNTVNELQNRLKTNVETIQQLHKQLSELNKENLRQRALLDRQSISRKSLHAQLKSKENDLELLKDDMNKSLTERELNDTGSLRSSRLSKPDSVSSLLNKELERAGVTSAEALDKSYWIQRVGELSTQLQQSSDYWTQKLNSRPT